MGFAGHQKRPQEQGGPVRQPQWQLPHDSSAVHEVSVCESVQMRMTELHARVEERLVSRAEVQVTCVSPLMRHSFKGCRRQAREEAGSRQKSDRLASLGDGDALGQVVLL